MKHAGISIFCKRVREGWRLSDSKFRPIDGIADKSGERRRHRTRTDWIYGPPFVLGTYINRNNTIIIEKPTKFELTDEILNNIVLHVKQHLQQNVQPQIIEKIIESPNNIDPTVLTHQQDLIEKLYLEVDSLKEKLAANENIDEQISYLSSKQNMEMFVNLFGLDKKDGSPVTKDDIKEWLRKETVNKEEVELKLSEILQTASADMGKKISDAVKSEVAQQKVILSNSMASPSIVNTGAGCNCEETIHKVVSAMLAVYDADKTGKVDYAMESAGGEVISTRCSESYQPKTAVYTILGIPFWYRSNTPRTAITPGTAPGECWAFQGFPGYLVIKLHTRISVTGFTMEHTPIQLSPTGRIDSAPKNFTVWGLQDEMDHDPLHFGTYEYVNDSSAIQYFPVQNLAKASNDTPPGYEIVELRIESNHGHPHHTCLYRFRVHGDPAEDMSFYGDNAER